MYWNGNRVADGVALAAGNVNTAGNGDSVVFGTSSTGNAVYAENGFDFWIDNGSIRRLDTTTLSTATKHAVQQITFTPQMISTAAGQLAVARNTANANVGGIQVLSTTSRFAIRLSTTDLSGGTATQSPVIAINNKYLIDIIYSLSASPTTSNGRIIVRITNQTDATWNGTGVWYYDTGYTQNIGTSDINAFRFGGIGGAYTVDKPSRAEHLGWNPISSNITTASSRQDVEPYFMAAPNNNILPIVDAGVDQSVDPNLVDTYTLTATASDQDGTIASYLWEDITGSPTTVSGSGNSRTLPVVRQTTTSSKTYRITVTDNSGGTAIDTVVVNFMPHTRWEKIAGALVAVRRVIAAK